MSFVSQSGYSIDFFVLIQSVYKASRFISAVDKKQRHSGYCTLREKIYLYNVLKTSQQFEKQNAKKLKNTRNHWHLKGCILHL